MRADSPYTDIIVDLLQTQAATSTADPSSTGAVEAAASLIGRAFASAHLVNAPTGLVPPGVLAHVGRQLILRGDVLYVIDVGEDGLTLLPASQWDVSGGVAPSSWAYRATMPSPSGVHTATVPAASVVHFRYSVDPARPWVGVGPLTRAGLTARLSAGLEAALGDEVGSARGSLIPVPTDGQAGTLDNLRADLKKLRGEVALVETTAGGWGTGPQTAPRGDWVPSRIGANPPPTLAVLRSEAAQSVLAACGVPVELVVVSDGTGQREAWRRFLHGTVEPLARPVVQELRNKLELPGLDMDFSGLFASDLSGRARAYQSLVGGGMVAEKAANLAGLS